MTDNLWHQLNAVLGSLTVTVGTLAPDWRSTGASWYCGGNWSCDSAGLEMSVHWLYLGYQHIVVGSGKYSMAHDADGGPATIGA